MTLLGAIDSSCWLRQIYQRMHQGRHCTDSEMKVARDMRRCQDTDRDIVPTIARMALLVAPQEGESDEAKAASIADFAKQHQLYLEALVDGHLTVSAAGEAAKLTEGLLRLLQLRHRRCSTERFGLYLTTSLDEGGGKVHRWLKGEQQPDAMFSTVFSQLVTDPDQILQEKLEE